MSHNRPFVMALKDYVRRRQNRKLLARINAAHADEPSLEERTLRHKSKRAHREIVEGEMFMEPREPE